MPDVYTAGDAIRVYLTGASSDGAAQTDPNVSLGNYRSSSLCESLGIVVAGGPANITVDFASGANGEGAGSVSAESADTLAWTPPGGSKGDAVTIANGETKQLVAGGSHPEKFVIVSRTSATALSGTATVTLSDVFNNVAGFDNVSTAEQGTGDTEYRCLCFKNVSSSAIADLKCWLKVLGTANEVDTGYDASGATTITCKSGSFDDWEESGNVENDVTGELMYYSERTSSVLTIPAAGRNLNGAGESAGNDGDAITPVARLRLGKEAPSAQPSGYFTDKTGAGEGSAPGGVTFYNPHAEDDADVIDIGTLAAGYIYALWIERKVTASATAEASILNAVEYTFEAL